MKHDCRSTWSGGKGGSVFNRREGAARALAEGWGLIARIAMTWISGLGQFDLAKAATPTPGLIDDSYRAEFRPGERPKRIAVHRNGSLFALLDGFHTDLERFPLVVRFLPNGNRDPDFRAPVLDAGETYRFESMSVGPDGTVFLGGWMDPKLQGTSGPQDNPRKAALRCLKPDGSWNDAFHANRPDFTGIELIHPLEDGGVWICGRHLEGGPRVLMRLDAKGMVVNRGWSVGGPGWFGVRSMVSRADGKWVIAGEIRCSEMPGIVGLARLQPQGELDTTFRPQPLPPKGGSLALVRSAVGQADGSILACGVFVGMDTHSTLSVARLLDSGEPDVRFRVRSIDNIVDRAWEESDGRVLIHGSFTKVDGLVRRGFARLLSDGRLDSGYAVEVPDTDLVEILDVSPEGIPHLAVLRQELGRPRRSFVVRVLGGSSPIAAEASFARQPTGGAYRVGAAHEFAPVVRCPPGTQFQWEHNEIPIQGSTNAFLSLPRLGTSHSGTYRLRLSTTTGSSVSEPAYLIVEPTIAAAGWPDLSQRFDGGPNGIVQALLNLPDGRILVGGRFGRFGERMTGSLAMLDDNGGLDVGLTNSVIAMGSVDVLELDPDGRIIAAGFASFSSSAGVKRRSLVRLNADRTLDPGFDARLLPGSSVTKIVCLADGSYLVKGQLRFDEQNGLETSLIRLLPDGTRDPSYGNPFGADAGDPQFLRLEGGRIVALYAVRGPDSTVIARISHLTPNGQVDPAIPSIAVSRSGPIWWMRESMDSFRILGQFRCTRADGAVIENQALVEHGNVTDPGGEWSLPPNNWGFTAIRDRAGRILFRGLGGVVRFDSGKPDRTFRCDTDGGIQAMIEDRFGNTYIGGNFSQVNGAAFPKLARLLADGARQPYLIGPFRTEFGIRLELETHDGWEYSLQSSESLDRDAWIERVRFIGQGRREVLEDSHVSRAPSGRFYRIQVVQAPEFDPDSGSPRTPPGNR